jgi:hypothetical protein
MVGVAGGILAIILFTGNHDPAPPRTAAASSVAALAPNPEQLRTYQRRLEASKPADRAAVQPDRVLGTGDLGRGRRHHARTQGPTGRGGLPWDAGLHRGDGADL